MPTFFDAHLHIIDPRFPLTENQGFLPAPFTCTDYLAQIRDNDCVGGAVVSGSFQAFDQSYLLHALHTLGPSFVGVTQLPYDTSDQQILDLHAHGVRAIRFNVKRGGSETLAHLDTMARRVYELAGWHTELYIDASELPARSPVLRKLPALSIDHLGLSRSGLKHLLDLVDVGVRVKATGFGRGDLDVPQALRAICAVNPSALMFGTDLPSTRAKRPYEQADLLLIRETLDDGQADRVCFKNALAWYLKR